MASIVKRKNRYSVVYTYKDDDGNQHQKWETFDTNADAKKRKTQIEFEQQSGTFIIPNATTVADLLEEYCSVYGVNNWAMSTYRSKKGLMYNYIIPLIGDVKLDELTPRLMDKFYTSLVLKTPKTKTSVRKIFLPSTVAQMLLERKKQIDEMKELFGDEYLDYDLVFCHSSGRPMEGQVINRALKKLIQDNDLPDVVFHSFRHASITYKLKWNGGDMKSVQGDSGHARMDMVADVYSHIIDEDRRYNAQKFEEQFYNAKGLKNAEEGKTAPMPKFETSVELLDPMAEVQKGSEVEEEKPAENSADENAALLAKLLSNPDTAALLKALAKTI